jgi:hypothetical protein
MSKQEKKRARKQASRIQDLAGQLHMLAAQHGLDVDGSARRVEGDYHPRSVEFSFAKLTPSHLKSKQSPTADKRVVEK